MHEGRAGRITKRIYGSMASREQRWYSISVWAVDATGRGSFWDSSKVFCRRTAMRPMIRSADQKWFTSRVLVACGTIFF
jgi:hypothetical protein